MIGPGALILYGFAATKWESLFDLSRTVQKGVWLNHPHTTTTLDNYLQWAPAAAVYALNFAGVKGEHNFVDRSMIYVISNVIMEDLSLGLKISAMSFAPIVMITNHSLPDILLKLFYRLLS